MEAILKSMKLCQSDEREYWELNFEDEYGNPIGTATDLGKTDDISFRKQTFEIMTILNNFNLFNLGQRRIEVPIFKDTSRACLLKIANSDGEFVEVAMDGKIIAGREEDMSDYEESRLVGLRSGSLCLNADTEYNYTTQTLSNSAVYIGFKPLNSTYCSSEQEEFGATNFKNFICQIMKISKVDELLPEGIQPVYPRVNVELGDDGKIGFISSLDNQFTMDVSTNSYSKR